MWLVQVLRLSGGPGRVAVLRGGWASRNPCGSQNSRTDGAGSCGSLGLPVRVQERCVKWTAFPAREACTHRVAIQAERRELRFSKKHRW